MKKLLKTLAVSAVATLVGASAFANYGWYDTSIGIGGIKSNFQGWSKGNGAADTDLGALTSLTLSSVEMNIWDDDNDRSGVNMFFRLYGDNGQIGGDVDVWLGNAERIEGSVHDFSVSYTGPFDLADAFGVTLEDGKTYYLNMWAKSYGDSGDHWYNGDGDNYHTKFVYCGTPKTYTLVESADDLVVGADYLVVSTVDGAYSAMKNEVNGSGIGCLGLADGAISGNTISAASDAIVWRLLEGTAVGQCELYNAAANVFAADSDDFAGRAQLLADGTDALAQWTIDTSALPAVKFYSVSYPDRCLQRDNFPANERFAAYEQAHVAPCLYRDDSTVVQTQTVTLDLNYDGADNPFDTFVAVVGEAYKVGGIPSPTRDNYRFRGWFTDPDDGEGERIRGYMIVPDDAESTLTLYAHWEQARQTVTFDANDGGAGATVAKPTASYQQGDHYAGAAFSKTAAVWEGHTFLGWYDDPDAGTRVTTADIVTPDAERTLYAHWRKDRQTVTFDANDGGAGAVVAKPTAKYDVGGNYSGAAFSMGNAVWDGYDFRGWYDDPTAGTRVKAGDVVTPESSRTLYAHWRKAKPVAITGFSVAFRGKAGARSTTPAEDVLTVTSLGITASSYAQGNFSDVTVTSAAKYAGQAIKNGNPAYIQIRKTSPGGIVTTASGGKAKKVTVAWSSGNTAGRYLTVYGKNSAYSTAADLYSSSTYGTELGSITNGTSTELEITGDYEYIGLLASAAIYMDSITIEWATAAAEPTVTVDPSEAKVAVNELLEITAAAEGFSGDVTWSWEGSGLDDENLFVFSASTTGVYTVTATAQYGSESNSASATITVCTPHAINVTVGDHGLAEAVPATAIAGTVVRVDWEADDGYTLDTITVNDGAVAVADDDTFEMPDAVANVSVTFKEKPAGFVKITSLADLTAGEYVITGAGSSGEYAMKAELFGGSTKAITNREDAVTIEHDAVAGTYTVTDADDDIIWTLAKNDDNQWTIYNAATGYVGYVASGNSSGFENPASAKSRWTIAESGDSDGLFLVQNVNTTNRFLKYNANSPRFACYTSGQKNLAFYKAPSAARTQTVTLDLNYDGADNPFDTFVAVVGEAYKVGGIPSPTRDNYRFRGWFTDPDDGEGERIRGYMIVPDDAESTLTLYAHWEQARQTVTFDANDGGAGAVVAKPSASYIQGGFYSGAGFSKTAAVWEGYQFMGWYDDPTAGTRVKSGDVVTSVSERTLYAHWKKARQTVTFDANDGGAGAVVAKPTAKYDIGGNYSGAAFSMGNAVWDGYDFRGWYDDPTAGTRVKAGDVVTPESARTLYAHWRRAKAVAITGFTVSPRAAGPAVRGARAATVECTLSFETLAGSSYEVLWTPSLMDEWEVVKSWTSTANGVTAVKVEVPADYSTGFFRLVEVFDD